MNFNTIKDIVKGMEFKTDCKILNNRRKALTDLLAYTTDMNVVKDDTETLLLDESEYNEYLNKLDNLEEVEMYLQKEYNTHHMYVLSILARKILDFHIENHSFYKFFD